MDTAYHTQLISNLISTYLTGSLLVQPQPAFPNLAQVLRLGQMNRLIGSSQSALGLAQQQASGGNVQQRPTPVPGQANLCSQSGSFGYGLFPGFGLSLSQAQLAHDG